MLFLILIQTLLLLFHKGTDGLEIVFDPLRLTSPCSQGLRNGTDNITFTGTVEGNFTALIDSNWNTFVTVQISDSSSQVTDICDITIGKNGFFCDPLSTKACYCDHSNSTTGSAHFVVKQTAQLKYSGGRIRAQLQNSNGSVVYSSNSILVPTIYDKKVSMDYTVNDGPTKRLSPPFGVKLVSNKNNSLQLCCIDSASRCYPRLAFSGQAFENQTGDCVSYTVFAPVNYTENVTLSYSVCTKNDYITLGLVMITSGEEDESSTTESETTEATTSAAGKQGSEKDNIPLIVCLSVIIPIVVIALCVAAVYYYKKNKKKSKAVTNGGTNESRPKENKQEGHETNETAPKDQDGQPSAGYVNHGFDRRTSPSSITVDTTQDNTPQQRTFKEKNGSNKQFTAKTNGSASKDTPGEPRQLPPVRGTHSHGYLQQPRGQSRPASVEMTSSAKK